MFLSEISSGIDIFVMFNKRDTFIHDSYCSLFTYPRVHRADLERGVQVFLKFNKTIFPLEYTGLDLWLQNFV